jgi:hypothetical protein
MRPVGRFPLHGLRKTRGVTFVFDVPNSQQWTKLRKAWGEPRYIVFACSDDYDRLHPFRSVSVVVEASVNGQQLAVTPAEWPPYVYSFEGRDFGVTFQPRPGDRVVVNLKTTRPEPLPEGELRVEPQWDGSMKDRIVNAGLNRQFSFAATISVFVGALMVLGGAALSWRGPA